MHQSRSEEKTQRLVHELEVHQIELEMQNAELRQARDETEKMLEKYTDLYDFAPVGYFTLDQEGAIREVNLTGAMLLGSERSKIIGRRFAFFVSEESRPAFADFLGNTFDIDEKISLELELINQGDQPLYVQIVVKTRQAGHECQFAVIDITERRRVEDALKEKRRKLEELTSSLEDRIVQAVEELRQKDQLLILQGRQAAMGEMINNIAHQWRQPLNMLGLLIQQLLVVHDTKELSREFLEQNIEKGMETIQHMSQTIEDFRNFFRSDKEVVVFSLTQVVEQTLSLVESSFKNQTISIDLRSEGDPQISGYPNEYSQVLLNILMNAQDALVGRNVADAVIEIHVFAEGGTSVVTIADNAGGITEEIMNKLFDPYFTTKGPDKGTGIGLFMSKTIVEKNMGGRLNVRNTGSGAEFRIEV